jgi:hypothetical protein
MRRLVEPELLDSLPPGHAAAVWSRRDLRRINWWMRNERHVAGAIASLRERPVRILELGAGDGTFMLKVAQRLGYGDGCLYLLDREPVVEQQTIERLSALGWKTTVIKADVHDWLQQAEGTNVDLITANLFLHHFQEAELERMFEGYARITRNFIACEPRRWRPALMATRLLRLIGCNHVTRHDAAVSVRAGFAERELSELWADESFELSERPAGLASHLFVAQRRIGS